MAHLQLHIHRETYFLQHEEKPEPQNPQVQSKHTFWLSGPSVQIVPSGQASHASETQLPWGFMNLSEGHALLRLRVSLSRTRFLTRCVNKFFERSRPVPLPRRRLLWFSCSCLCPCYHRPNDWCFTGKNVVRSYRSNKSWSLLGQNSDKFRKPKKSRKARVKDYQSNDKTLFISSNNLLGVWCLQGRARRERPRIARGMWWTFSKDS